MAEKYTTMADIWSVMERKLKRMKGIGLSFTKKLVYREHLRKIGYLMIIHIEALKIKSLR